MVLRYLVSVAFVLVSAACHRAEPRHQATETSTAEWLCLPDRAGDPCHRDQTATELPSGAIVPSTPASAPVVDCFYVYPTVDLQLVPGNHTDFADERIAEVAAVQAGRFREACALYAPFYRQVTIGTYMQPPAVLERGLAIGYADVERAFEEYWRKWNRGRRLALIGHSQGAEMIVRLLRRFFDGNDPAAQRARGQLVVAMPIGGTVEVKAGAQTGGTFSNLPICASPAEQGCIIAYRTHRAGSRLDVRIFEPAAGNETVCVNPANSSGTEAAALSRTFVPSRRLRRREPITTPFIVVRGMYRARCEFGPNGYRYLAITPPEDVAASPIDFSKFPEHGLLAPLGLHILDIQLAQGDLVDRIARSANH